MIERPCQHPSYETASTSIPDKMKADIRERFFDNPLCTNEMGAHPDAHVKSHHNAKAGIIACPEEY